MLRKEMVLKTDQHRVKTLLSETITLLCKNGLKFNKELRVEALIGITIDQDDVVLISLNETIRHGITPVLHSPPKVSSPPAKVPEKSKSVGLQKAVLDAHVQKRQIDKHRLLTNENLNADIAPTEQLDLSMNSSQRNRRTCHVDGTIGGACQESNCRKDDLPVSKKRKRSANLESLQPSRPKSDIKHEPADADGDESTSSTTLIENDEDDDSTDDVCAKQEDISDDESSPLLALDVDGKTLVDWERGDDGAGHSSSSHRRSSIENSIMLSYASSELKLDRLCPICGRCLRRACDLSDHIASVHGKQKLYFCDLCQKDFGYRHNFRRHMKGHMHNESSPRSRDNLRLGV